MCGSFMGECVFHFKVPKVALLWQVLGCATATLPSGNHACHPSRFTKLSVAVRGSVTTSVQTSPTLCEACCVNRTVGQHRTANRHEKLDCCVLFLSEMVYMVSLPQFLIFTLQLRLAAFWDCCEHPG